MPQRRFVTLLTDFGTADTFVAQMKGALLGVNPEAVVLDLTHEVPPQDVEAAAFLLATAYAAFPPGTVHVVVVDPGVGTARRRVAARTDRYTFVAPDNGVLTRVLDEGHAGTVHAIEASHYFAPEVSATFEGRDVFAPVAGWISRGIELANFGPPAGPLVRLPSPAPLVRGSSARVRVALVDRFGNVALDLDRRRLADWLGGPGLAIRVETPAGEVSSVRRTYADGEDPGPFLLLNSAGYVEIAVREGRADQSLGLARGAEVVVHPS